MGRRSEEARTPSAPGLFLSAVRVWVPGTVVFLLTVSVLTCGGQPAPPEPTPSSVTRTLPPLRSGGASPAAEARAARLLQEARIALEADSLTLARDLARRIVEETPAAPGASEGLWILARADHRVGDHDSAAEAAARFGDLLPEDHRLILPVLLLRADALAAADREGEAARAYLSVPPGAPDSVRYRALESLRALAPEMRFSDLESVVTAPPPGGWELLRAPLLAEYALALHVRDRRSEARVEARRALELGADGDAAELARSVLDDAVTVERRRAAVLGAILPRSGSPGEQRYAQLIHEGIQARLSSVPREGLLPTTLEVRDDSGSVQSVPRLVSELGERSAAGIIGPVGSQALAAAARARTAPTPMISPTAGSVPDGVEAVYSLGAPDPGGAVALARFAAARGLDSAVVLHARTEEFSFEAEEFVRAYEDRGGRVLRRIEYEPGSTFFEEPLRTVRELLPAALVLPVPAGDIELLAPQITFFGLDTLGVRVLGTESWGEPGGTQSVEPRHTDGVVLATPRVPGGEAPGWESFVRSYEQVVQRTLRSRVPAYGYDAASLLLEAVQTGARDPEEVREALEEIEDFPGATGSLSVRDGRVVRRYHLARLRDRELIPVFLGIRGGDVAGEDGETGDRGGLGGGAMDRPGDADVPGGGAPDAPADFDEPDPGIPDGPEEPDGAADPGATDGPDDEDADPPGHAARSGSG